MLTLIAVIALAFFIVWELTAKNIRSSTCRSSSGAISGRHGCDFGRLRGVLRQSRAAAAVDADDIGYRSVDAGLVTAPLGIFAVLLSPVMGKILPRPMRA